MGEIAKKKTGLRGIDAFHHFRRVEKTDGQYRIRCAFCPHQAGEETEGKSVAGVAARVKSQMRKHVMNKHRKCSRCGDYGHNAKNCRAPKTAVAEHAAAEAA